MSRTEGITEEELRALSEGCTARAFTPRETVALAYAAAVTLSHTVPDPVYAAVRAQFSEEEIIELTATITWEICAAKFNRALEIEWPACPIPG